MFKESIANAPEIEAKKDFAPEELGDLTIDEVFEKLGIKEPEPEEITDLKSYMAIQTEVMQGLIDAFHDQEAAINLFQQKLSEKFAEKYRHGF